MDGLGTAALGSERMVLERESQKAGRRVAFSFVV